MKGKIVALQQSQQPKTWDGHSKTVADDSYVSVELK
jgi:hypothetical protein